MKMLNNISIGGRLTGDPILRTTQSNHNVVSFTLAVERDFRDGNGERETDFIDIVAWRNTADFIHRHFTKGRMMIVRGRLQTRNWQDQQGNKRKTVEIIAESAYFGDSKPESGGGSYAQHAQNTYNSPPAAPISMYPPKPEPDPCTPAQTIEELIDDDGELPF
jgi:single-strand DNA-binding protein